MHSSTSNTIVKMPVPSPTTLAGYPTPTSGFFQAPPLVLNDNGNHGSRFTFPEHAPSPASYADLVRTWNYNRFLTSTKPGPMSDNHLDTSEYHSRNSSFHQSPNRFLSMPYYHQSDDEIVLSKFCRQTLVKLDTGEMKNIEQLTTNDLMASAQQSHQYSSLLARVEHIGCVDKLTGKAELRFYIDEIEKTTSYHVLQDMPFFVYQHSRWSSISPEQTRHRCGLDCRQLECGDLIIAITEQRSFPSKSRSSSSSQKPNYSQQSPTKCLVDRYLNGQRTSSISLSSNKRRKLANEQYENTKE